MSQMQHPFRLDPRNQRYGSYSRQRQMTLTDLLMENRIIFLGSSPDLGFDSATGEITDYLANIIIQRLLFLQYENKNQEIHMYINSPGGSVYRDARHLRHDAVPRMPHRHLLHGHRRVRGRLILAAGTKGKRFALPNSKVMIHQPWGQVGGQITDMEIQANEFAKDRQRLNEILAKHTGQPLDRIAKETDRDRLLPRRGGEGVRPRG